MSNDIHLKILYPYFCALIAEHISTVSTEKPSAAPRQFTQFFGRLSD